MITEKSDIVSDNVMEWLVRVNSKVLRINDDEFIDDFSFLENKNINKIWQRRGTFNFYPKALYFEYPDRKEIMLYLNKEIEHYLFYIEDMLKLKLGRNYIGSFSTEVNNNKLVNLEVARNIGLNIPSFGVFTSKKPLLSFLKKHKQIITKDLRAPVNIKTESKIISSTGVKIIDKDDIKKLDENFAPIYVQKYIEKKYEVRVFIFSELFFAMAIFSQNDDKTKIDFRNYNTGKPNRCIPFVLPQKVEVKIKKFLKKSNIDTGSIDIIVTPNDNFYFLEINPMGQFHWLSSNCNYYIEKKIANFLMND